MINQSLVALTNSVLGTGKATARGNYAYHCPLCHHHKPKLEINMSENAKGENAWLCWVCDKKGKKIYQLFKAVEVSPDVMTELRSIVKYTGPERQLVVEHKLELPKEYKKFDEVHPLHIPRKEAFNYLKKRGITQEIIDKYQIGLCIEGEYSGRIIVPSFNKKGELNFFVSRSWNPKSKLKYKNPEAAKDFLIFNESLIDFKKDIYIVEGVFDSFFLDNSIALLGKYINDNMWE
jgi:hypothetical protein